MHTDFPGKYLDKWKRRLKSVMNFRADLGDLPNGIPSEPKGTLPVVETTDGENSYRLCACFSMITVGLQNAIIRRESVFQVNVLGGCGHNYSLLED